MTRFPLKPRPSVGLDDGLVPAVLDVRHGSRCLLRVEPGDYVSSRVAEMTSDTGSWRTGVNLSPAVEGFYRYAQIGGDFLDRPQFVGG